MTYDTLYVVGRHQVAPPPPPFRAQLPWRDPFPSDSFWNMPVGSEMTYLATSDAAHVALVGASSNWNATNWTDPFYLSTASDPLVTVEHRGSLPSGWNTLTNSQSGTPTGAGALVKRYTGIRVPASATWQSTSNTDRKVIVVQGTEVTLNIYDSTNALISSVTYPAGTLSVEMHKFYRTTTANLIYTTNLSKNDVVNGYGLTEGAIASGISPSQGYVRSWEIAAALAGDRYAIKHALKVGTSNAMLKAGPIWPSRLQDGDSSSYTGQIPYGTHIVLPPSFNVNAAAGSGTPQADLNAAVLHALQLYGGYILIRSGSGSILGFGSEPIGTTLTSTQTTALRTALNAAIPSLRISANSHLVGTLRSDRQPVDSTLIAGGGTRLTAGLGLSDLDDATGLKLPIDPAGPWT